MFVRTYGISGGGVSSSAVTSAELTSAAGYINDDFIQYISAENGDDSNTGFAQDLPLLAGGTTQSATITGTPGALSVSASSLNMAVNQFASPKAFSIIIQRTVAQASGNPDSAIIERQERLISSNTSNTFIPTTAFNPIPNSGDVIIISDPIKTYDEHLNRMPAVWGKKHFNFFSTENSTVQTGSGATIVAGAPTVALPNVTLMRVTNLSGMTSSSKGRILCLGGASGLSVNKGMFEIASFINSTTVDVKNSATTIPDAGPFSWAEITGYITNQRECMHYSGSPKNGIFSTPIATFGDFSNELGTLTCIAGTSNQSLVTTSLGIPLPMVITAITSIAANGIPIGGDASQISPQAGQKIDVGVGVLTAHAHKGRSLLVTVSSTGKNTMREIIDNDANGFIVSMTFPTSGSQAVIVGDTVRVDLCGSVVTMLTGAAAGQRRLIKLINPVSAADATTVIPNVAFTGTVSSGDTFIVERSACLFRYAKVLDFDESSIPRSYRGCRFTTTSSTAAGFFVLNFTNLLFEGCEIDLRNTNWVVGIGSFVNAPGGNPANDTDYSVDNIFQGTRSPTGMFLRDGSIVTTEVATVDGNYYMSNMTFNLADRSVGSIQSISGRQTTIIVDHSSTFQHGGTGNIRSQIDRSKSTSASVGIIDVSNNSFVGSGTRSASGTLGLGGIDINSGDGHGLRVAHGSFANITSLGGTGNAGYGIENEFGGRCSIRTSGADNTTITGTLGDTRISVTPAGTGIARTYTQLNQTKGFAANVSINNLGPRTETTGGSTTVVTDSGLALVADDYVNAILHVTSGANANAKRRITTNTTTAFTVDVAFSAAVAVGDTFCILPNSTGDIINVVN